MRRAKTNRAKGVHAAAAAFPLLGDAELAALAADIRERGLLRPVVLVGNLVLDGRNRLAACELAGVEPHFVQFSGKDPLAYVLSENLHRRHLSESQRALVGARIATRPKSENLPVPTQAEAASRLSVSDRSMRHAREVLEGGAPEVVAAVERGELAVSAAAELSKLDADQQRAVLVRAIEKARLASAKRLNVRALVQAAKRAGDPALSQWDSTPELARRMAAWLPAAARRILEPSAGQGALVSAALERCSRAAIVAIEIDPERRKRLEPIAPTRAGASVRVVIGDYLALPPPPKLYDATIANPPFDDGAEVDHLAKMLDESRLIVVQLPTRSLHGRERFERVWRRVGVDWWIRREARLVTRPKYEGDGGRDEIVVLRLERAPGECVLEWWDLGEAAHGAPSDEEPRARGRRR